MELPKVKAFDRIYPLFIKTFDDFQPVDENSSVTSKINSMVSYLNTMGHLTNNVVDDWNKVMKWFLDNGFSEVIEDKIKDGYLDETLKEFADEIKDIISGDLTDVNNQLTSLTELSQELINLINQNQVAKQSDLEATNAQLANILTKSLMDLKDTPLTAGSVIRTKGFYSSNDGGKASYLVTDLDGNENSITLSNGLVITDDLGIIFGTKKLILLLSSVIDLRQIGCIIGEQNTINADIFNHINDYLAENKIKIVGSKTFWIDKPIYLSNYLQIQNKTTFKIKATDGFSDIAYDFLVKSKNYDTENLSYLWIEGLCIDGNFKKVQGFDVMVDWIYFDNFSVINCLNGGYNSDKNVNNPIKKWDWQNNDWKIPSIHCGSFRFWNCGGTCFRWNHHSDSWIGRIDGQGLDTNLVPINSINDIAQYGVIIGENGQCEIDKIHIYGFLNGMLIQSRITANMLIVESCFDNFITFDLNATMSMVDKIEVFNNLTPTGNFVNCREGRNDVPFVSIKAYLGVIIDKLKIKAFWADPEKINDSSSASNTDYANILASRKTKWALDVQTESLKINHVHITGKQDGDETKQAYWVQGMQIKGNNNRISGYLEYCNLGLSSTTKNYYNNTFDLSMYNCKRAWLNTQGTGAYGGNKFRITSKGWTGDLNMFHSNYQDISFDYGDRMEYVFDNGVNRFVYPFVGQYSFDLGVTSISQITVNHNLGRTPTSKEVQLTLFSDNTTPGLSKCAFNLTQLNQYTATLFFLNEGTSQSGLTAKVNVRIGR